MLAGIKDTPAELSRTVRDCLKEAYHKRGDQEWMARLCWGIAQGALSKLAEQQHIR